jgi:hypothetical protein
MHKTIILHVVLYGHETLSLTLREEHRLRVFENRVLRRLLEPKREQVAGSWGRLNSEDFRNLYASPSIIGVIKLRRMSWMGHAVCMGRIRNVYKIFVRKTEG